MESPAADAIEIPLQAEAVTAAWLTRAMSAAAPGVEILDARPVEFIHGASSKLRMAVRSNRNTIPSSLIIKGGFEAHSAAMAGMHLNEMHAYRDLVPTLPIETPRCYFAERDAEGRSLLVLEDLSLRDVRFLSLLDPLPFDVAAGFLDGLAQIHARWWASPELARGGRFDWAPDTRGEEQIGHYFDILNDPERLAAFLTAPRGAATPKSLHDAPRIRRAHAAMRARHQAQPKTMSHGDMHLGNLYTTADGRPGFLDWQPRIAPWSLDVTYFLIAGLDLVDRRRWEGALLQHYLTRLGAHGIQAPSFEEAWRSYRCDVIWGFLIWLLNGSNFQSEANNTAAATRFAMAMCDLDAFGALGV